MQYIAYGGPDQLVEAEVPDPEPGPSQVLVRVHATSVNPIDWKLAAGRYRYVRPVRMPAIPGFDVVGEIVRLGPGVTGWEVGERVWSRLDSRFGGASAELAVVDLHVLDRAPATLDDHQAAAVPLAGLTALQCLRDHGGLPMTGAEGRRVLVVGASGGVGHYAVQLARTAGAHVVGVCSGRNAEMVRDLGAHEVVDYTQTDDFRTGAPYDVILDAVGKAGIRGLGPLLAAKGRYVSVAPGLPEILGTIISRITGSRRCTAMLLRPRAEDLRTLAELADAGALRSVVDTVHPLADLAEAHRASMAGRTRGKLVIQVAPTS